MTHEATIEPMSRKQAAAFLGLAPGTLARWAVQGKGPRYSRSGETRGKVWYCAADLAAWLEAMKQGMKSRAEANGGGSSGPPCQGEV